jgi:cobalt/nickel transport system ATP-binding protein
MALRVLEADALCFAYGRPKWAIDHVNLALQEGDRLALLGANGAGKSTFLHLLIGLHSPCCGTLRLEGSPLSADARGRRLLRRSVGLVLQDPDDQLFADTVEADVIFGPLNSGLDRDAAEAVGRSAIGTMRISHLATRRISSLSLGEKKRVALAGVLAMSPRVLLLDEPTAGLDHRGAEALLAALDERSAEGIAIVLATHDSDLALRWATRAMVLEEGRVIAEGAPADVLQDDSLCLRAGIRQPALLEIRRRLCHRLSLDPGSCLPTSPDELAGWLTTAVSVREGAPL